MRDLRHSFRFIFRNKGYSLVIVFTFAVGIAACGVGYSLLESVLKSPLPFAEPERLVIITAEKAGNENEISLLDAATINERLTEFEDVAAYWADVKYNLSGEEGRYAEEVATTLCTSNLFEVLGVNLALGKVWPEDFDRRKAFGTVLSHELWARRYQKATDKVGDNMMLDTNGQYAVYGVLPEGFQFPYRSDIFRNIIIGESQATNRAYRNLMGVGKLSAGTSLVAAQEALDQLSVDLQTEFKENEGISYRIKPIEDLYLAEVSPYIQLILAAVACVFLLVCVNVSGLLLSMAHQRSKEIAVRRLIGSSALDIVRQYLIQNLLLAIAGCIFGLLASYWVLDALALFIAEELPFWVTLEMNPSVLLVIVGLSILAGILTALIPAIKTSAIKGKNLVGGSNKVLGFNQKLKDAIVVIQLSLGVALVFISSLIIKDFNDLQRVELGFDQEDLSIFEIAIPFDKYKFDYDAINAFYKRAGEAFESIAGVASVGLIDELPLANQADILSRKTISLEGQSPEEQALMPRVILQKTSHSYHNTMGIALKDGRLFNEGDLKTSGSVCIISESLAKRLWPGESAVGRLVKLGAPDAKGAWRTIVGVTATVKHQAIRDAQAFDFYVPWPQTVAYDAFFVLKTGLSQNQLSQAVSDKLREVDPDQSLFGYTTMSQVVDKQLWRQKVSGWVFSAFGSMAFLIAVIGVYAVVNHNVNHQLRPLSVRRVLGASDQQIVVLLVRRILLLSIIGAVVGVALLGLVQWTERTGLVNISITENLVSLVPIAVFVLAALLASYLPTRKVLKTSPSQVLRSN